MIPCTGPSCSSCGVLWPLATAFLDCIAFLVSISYPDKLLKLVFNTQNLLKEKKHKPYFAIFIINNIAIMFWENFCIPQKYMT